MNASMNYIKLISSLLLLLFLVDVVVPSGDDCDPSKHSIEDICLKTTPHPKVCNKALRSDPRSSTASKAKTLVQIMLDAVESNANLGTYRAEQYFNDARDPNVRRSLRNCSSMYLSILNQVSQAKYWIPYDGGVIAGFYMQCVYDDWDKCEQQFAAGQSPLTSVNRHGKKLTEVVMALADCSGTDK